MNNYPETYEVAKRIGIAPWTVQIRADFHVITFDDNGTLVFVPRFATDGVIADCVTTATYIGNRMLSNDQCTSFSVVPSDTSDRHLWPHVRLEVDCG